VARIERLHNASTVVKVNIRLNRVMRIIPPPKKSIIVYISEPALENAEGGWKTSAIF
jgi:hypothetical protein